VNDERVMPEPLAYTRPELPTCETTGKVMFVSPEAAERAAKEMRRRTDDRTHPYRCDHCRRWHLGHTETDKKTR
jgi:hypothetical protein